MAWIEVEKAKCRACGMAINFTSREDLVKHLLECPLREVENLFDILTVVN